MNGVHAARLQWLLAYLLLHRNAPPSRYHLAFLFWPDSTEAQARTNLHKLLHDLRHVLPRADRFLQADGPTLHWQADASFALDVADFEAALDRVALAARTGDQTGLRVALEEAADLYAGNLLPSCYDDWILPERERLSQAFVGVLERLMLLLEGQRDYQGAIGYAQRLLRHDPLHEAIYRHLMRLQALSGDRAGALRTYHACAKILQRELELLPLLQAIFAECNPGPLKTAMSMAGLPAGPVRLPLKQPRSETVARLREVMTQLGLVEVQR